VTAFHGHDGHPLKRPTLLAVRGGLVDGQLPPESELAALQAAINFALLVVNPRWNDPNGRHFALTTDNTELFVWPIDLGSGYVVFRQIGGVSRLDGGYQIENDLIVPPPMEPVVSFGNVSPVPEVVQAIFEMPSGRGPRPDDPLTNRLFMAISWFAQA